MGNATQASPARVDRDRLAGVPAQLVFARRSSDEAAPAAIAPKAYSIPVVSYDVTIRNARPIVDELSLDKEGFALIKHKISCTDVRDPNLMRDRYLEEMVPFIKDYFKASRVVPKRNGVVLRRADQGANPANMAPISKTAHSDYAPIAGPVLAAAESQEQGIPITAYSRLMIIQAWRVLSPPPQDFPLTVCDASTIPDRDMLVVDYGRNEPGWHKSWSIFHSPAHRWYYFPEMTADEFIMWKGYDSATHYNVRSAHTAFDDRHTYPNAIPRESVEARFFVYYD
ncbi:CmcJ/NvfI family oxidoreductase [Bradyrhizobium sp. Arg816]|uniref:CmcJ/NvfI family oxidoreductase n=1 Tax=Bradyrhizobium sp. Arg816 TaxID=2998491 RepID=UPI00249EA9B6|nr:CmcJ/NvfI family oxidoreductase [Bradyrhizobium sp. Arg816]MDI3567435.1 CmcJ/NvfI family oxidoreductase [Bradyrhizobium sp. Arg816]